jgi:histidyl-tRNA synthetase
MGLNKKPYKGCRDFFPEDMRTRNYFFEHMRTAAESYAYEPYDGPLLEEVELYKAKSGEELINEQIYSFTDRGNREVAIRPEMTPTVARMVANVHKQEAKPLRWYSIPNLMRYEKPQRGRVREHWQFNVDIFGAPKNLGEIEVLSLIAQFLKSFGATNQRFSILINDRSIVDAVFNKLLNLDNENSYKLYKIIDKAKKVTTEKLDIMVSEVISDEESKLIFTDYLKLSDFSEIRAFLEKYEIEKECETFLSFTTLISQTEVIQFVKYDPTIVRGLDYYTGIVFEVFDEHPYKRRAIAGGGAYAHLLQIFNEQPLQGFGFGLGDVTLRDFLQTHNLLPDFSNPKHDIMLFYTRNEEEIPTFTLAENLRSRGVKTEVSLGTIKFNKIFKLAENKGHKKVGIIEKKDDKLQIKIKDLTDKTATF